MAIIEHIVHHLRTMNLRHVQVFVRVADEGGFTAAARALGVPKSAVSAAVARLEEELGARLLHRSSRRVVLTEAGAALHRQARPALRALDEAEAAVLETQTALRGSVRITAPVEVGTRLLEPHLTRFLARHPGVSVDVVLTTRVIDLATEGFDLAIRGGPVRDPSLVARPLRAEDAGLFAAPSYLAARGQPRRVRDLAAHDCVVHRPTAGRATWTLIGPRGPERVEVTARLGADHFAFIVRAVASGAGIGLLPLFLCDTEVARGDLVRVLPRHAMRGTRLHLVYPSARYLPRRVAALRDFLLDTLRPAK
jgi:DNA-binding transcriptional LysR family regulator